MKNLFVSHHLQDFLHRNEGDQSLAHSQENDKSNRRSISNEATQTSTSSVAKNRSISGEQKMFVEGTVNGQSFQTKNECFTKKQNELHRSTEGIFFLIVD
jgi:hypothetical protein